MSRPDLAPVNRSVFAAPIGRSEYCAHEVYSTCLHEAAHAVVALMLGVRVREVAVVVRDHGRRGLVAGGHVLEVAPLWLQRMRRRYYPLRRRGFVLSDNARRDTLVRHCTVVIAGQEAEELWCEYSQVWRRSSDEAVFGRYAHLLGLASMHAMYEHFQQECRRSARRVLTSLEGERLTQALADELELKCRRLLLSGVKRARVRFGRGDVLRVVRKVYESDARLGAPPPQMGLGWKNVEDGKKKVGR